MVKIAVIGTAGRDKSQTYTADLFNRMVVAAKYIMRNLTNITLISGGAAWADHVAVQLFLEGFASKLILCLPCEWKGSQYLDTGVYDWRINPGRTSNYYHSEFSTAMNRSTLFEIQEAIDKGAEVQIHKGFHNRNSSIANCDYMIAFTWSSTDVPADGGTLYTWNKCTTTKYHISLTKI
ncbi:Hypothetical protein HVR_LOCUS818 [uncultured virus]|nr:Hypothetical protein HVR_LOCUS818 [uncultured virus]